MARALVATISPHYITSYSSASIIPTSFSRLSLSNHRPHRLSFRSLVLRLSFARRYFCKLSTATTTIDISSHREAFAKRMAMAGLKPHHRIALGVSGGPDSMALCLLMAHWKANSASVSDRNGFIDGLMAIIVDHGLRTESREEAEMVSSRVSKLGISCEIATGDWSNGRPKQGHLQEAARDLRYRVFQEVCFKNQIGVLLIAHHADDQICKEGNQEWVEDPTNRSQLFARNRIRKALIYETSCAFKSELQRLISTCRRVRTYVDSVSHTMIDQAVKIMDYGYAVIDLKLLDPSNREDICLSKFMASILQFISQRNRPVRGNASKLLLDYVRTFPCKASLTAASCYLCPAPGTKGTKVLVCCSVESVLPSRIKLYTKYLDVGYNHFVPHEVEQNMMEGRSYMEQSALDPSDMSFLNEVSSDALLNEAKKLNILTEPTYRKILEMKMCEADHFKSTNAITSINKIKQTGESATPCSHLLQPGQSCYFMNRFKVTWSTSSDVHRFECSLCSNGHEIAANMRHMIEEDWLYLAQLSKSNNGEKLEKPEVLHNVEECSMETTFSDYARLSAEQALASLKNIPAAARRALPVLVSTQGCC